MPTDGTTPGEAPPPGELRGEVRLPSHWARVRPGFRNRILAGLIFIVPLAMTFLVARWIYIKGLEISPPWLKQIYERYEVPAQPPAPGAEGQPPAIVKPQLHRLIRWGLQFSVFVVTLVIIGALLWVIGSLSSNFLMRLMIRSVERVIFGIPLVRSVYIFSKQIMELISENKQGSFQRVVLVEFPKENVYVLGFATGATAVSGHSEPYVTVFVPTTPNPTSGYLALYPLSHVREVKVSTDEAVKIIVSGGIITPATLPVVPYALSPAGARAPASQTIPAVPGGQTA